jgi:hypothetical protein
MKRQEIGYILVRQCPLRHLRWWPSELVNCGVETVASKSNAISTSVLILARNQLRICIIDSTIDQKRTKWPFPAMSINLSIYTWWRDVPIRASIYIGDFPASHQFTWIMPSFTPQKQHRPWQNRGWRIILHWKWAILRVINLGEGMGGYLTDLCLVFVGGVVESGCLGDQFMVPYASSYTPYLPSGSVTKQQ